MLRTNVTNHKVLRIKVQSFQLNSGRERSKTMLVHDSVYIKVIFGKPITIRVRRDANKSLHCHAQYRFEIRSRMQISISVKINNN